MDTEGIDNAIGVHLLWKSRLQQAIVTGRLDVSVGDVASFTACSFGKWLYGSTVTPAMKNNTYYNSIKELHAEFHRIAAQVAKLALAGKKEDAKMLMAPQGEYATISRRLTDILVEWKESLP